MNSENQHDQGVRRIIGQGGLPMLEIKNRHASSLISLYGGHVLSFIPAGEEEVLFLSAESSFREGAPIRGGIPLCWPWFGAHATDSQKPLHGFARLSQWQMEGTGTTADGATQISLGLTDSDSTTALWPHSFRLRLRVTVGPHLHIALEMENRSAEPQIVTGALHTYLRVAEAEHVQITGLDDTFYIDTLAGNRSFLQRGKLQVNEEINRIYLETANSCIVHDPILERQIIVKKTGSRTTVVWNPWEARSRSLPDFGDEEYRRMVCIEAANTRQDVVTLAPGGSHTLATEIGLIR